MILTGEAVLEGGGTFGTLGVAGRRMPLSLKSISASRSAWLSCEELC